MEGFRVPLILHAKRVQLKAIKRRDERTSRDGGDPGPPGETDGTGDSVGFETHRAQHVTRRVTRRRTG